MVLVFSGVVVVVTGAGVVVVVVGAVEVVSLVVAGVVEVVVDRVDRVVARTGATCSGAWEVVVDDGGAAGDWLCWAGGGPVCSRKNITPATAARPKAPTAIGARRR